MKQAGRILTVILSLVVLILLSSCRNTGFVEADYIRDLHYSGNFRMMLYEGDAFSFGIEESLYDERQANEVRRDLEEKVKKVNVITENAAYIRVFLLPETAKNVPYISGNTVFLTKSELEDGDYLYYLAQTVSKESELWVNAGIAAEAFGITIDDDEIAAQINQLETLDVLAFSSFRFMEDWNSETEIEFARSAAASYYRYLRNSYSPAEIALASGKESKQAWLKTIGAEQEYNSIFEDAFSEHMFYKGTSYPLVVRYQDIEYYIRPMKNSSEWGCGIETAADIEYFLYRDQVDRNAVLKYFSENLSDTAYLPKEPKEIDVFFDETIPTSFAYWNEGRIVLKYPDFHIHEWTHMFYHNTTDSVWWNEGIAEYTSMLLLQGGLRQRVYSAEYSAYYLSGRNDLPTFNRFFLIYEDMGGDLNSLEDLDMRLFVDAYSRLSFETNPEWVKFGTPFYDVSSYEYLKELNIDGSELSYGQACSFIAYLVDNYSLDAVMAFGLSKENAGNFEAVFKKGYSELKADWMETIGVMK